MQGFIHRTKKYLHSVLKSFARNSKKKEFYIWIGLFILLFGIFYYNSLHEEFTDEFDNILGGMYILRGKLPYVGFFSHHGPFAYWVASIIALFSGGSFVAFRFLYAVFLLALLLGGYYAVRKSVGRESSKFYIGFVAIFAIAATYFWGHLLVADSLAAVLLAPAIAIIFLKGLYGAAYRIRDLVLISILLSAAFLTSLTFSYLIFGLYLFAILHYFRFLRIPRLFTILFPFMVFAAPFGAFFLYLILTGSLTEYVKQSIIFNQRYYVYNYPRAEGSTVINPLRYAIVITYNFFQNFRDVLIQAGSFNFTFPLNITLAIGNLFVLIYLLYRRKYMMFFFVLFILIFSNTRSNPLESKEKDFQSAVYFIISFLNISFLLTKLWEKLTSAISLHSRVIYTVLFFFLSIYSFYAASYLLFGFSSKAYNKYMGFEPAIYDRTELAPIVNAATPENDYAWIGPIEFEELMYLDRRTPSKYHVLIPGIGRSPETLAAMTSEFTQNMPTVIWFDKNYHILGQNAQEFAPSFIEFLNKNYVTLYDENSGSKEYSSVIPRDQRIDVEGKLYIRRDRYQEVVNRLLQQNIIKPSE